MYIQATTCLRKSMVLIEGIGNFMTWLVSCKFNFCMCFDYYCSQCNNVCLYNIPLEFYDTKAI